MAKMCRVGVIILIVTTICIFYSKVVGENYNSIELDTLKEYSLYERGLDMGPDYLIRGVKKEESVIVKSRDPQIVRPLIPPEPEPTIVEMKRELIVNAAYSQIGKPYVYAGRSPGIGFDCSGLVVYVYEQTYYGYMPHGATDQALGHGVAIPYNLDLMLPGDLIFFGYYSHVGIYVGNGLMIHASSTYGVVQLIALDNYPNYPTLIKRLYQ